MFKSTKVDEAYFEFIEITTRVYTAHFPFRTLKRSKKAKKPWVTRGHLKQIKQKNRLYFQFLRTQTEGNLKEFKTFRNKLNTTLRQAKKAYYEHLFSNIGKKRPDIIWKTINNVLGRGKADSSPETLTVNGTDLIGEALADHFNHHFTNVSNHYNYSLTTLPKISISTPETIFLRPTDETEVHRTFLCLKNSKALDYENIQIKPIKYAIEFLCPVLSYIFNLAIESGTFPEGMKRARVAVIFKGGNRNEATNYRPISILPVFSKGLEKIIYSRLINFLDKTRALTDCQFGFRKGKSTETALLAIKENILQSIEKGTYTLGLFVDFSKAFDCLDHNILLKKLTSYGIRGKSHDLLNSYLSNRSQCVCISNHQSSLLPISCGVPQGSVLGPLLFNLYINDIVHIDNSVQFIIYADDSTVLISGNDPNALVSHCNDVLEKLSVWSQLNRIEINTQKTKAILFRARNKKFILENSLMIQDKNIDLVDTHKILGVYFSCHLSWDTHVNYVARKISSVTGAMSRCRTVLPQEVKLQLYNALFAPHVSYCSLVWASTTRANIEKIIVLQKRYLRYLANIDHHSTTRHLFAKYKIISFDYHYEHRLLHAFYFSQHDSQSFLRSMALLQPRATPSLTRISEPWLVPYFRTQYKLQSLKHNMPVLLNQHKQVAFKSPKELRVHFSQL